MLGLALAAPIIAQTGSRPPLAQAAGQGPTLAIPRIGRRDTEPGDPAILLPESAPRTMARPKMPFAGRYFPASPQDNVNPGISPESVAPGPPTGGVTLENLQNLALNRHPALLQAAARVDAARGRWVQAGLRPNPRLGYSAQEMGNDGTAGIHGFFWSREYITGGKLGLAQSTASAEVRAAEEAWRITQMRVLADVRIAYINARIAQERLALAEQLLAIADDGVTIAEAKVEFLESADVERLQAQSEAFGAAVLVNNAQAEVAGAWRRLSVVTGGQQLNPERLAGPLEDNIPQLEWSSTLNRLFAESPLLANADARIAAARWNVQRQAVEPIPNVNVQAGVAHSTISNHVIANMQLSVAIPVNDANQGAVLAARASLTAAQRDRDRIMLNIEQRLASVFAEYSAAVRQVENYQRDILPNADRVFQLRTAAYRGDEADYVDVLTAQTTLFRFKQQYLQSLQDAHLTAARIEFLLLEDALGQ